MRMDLEYRRIYDVEIFGNHAGDVDGIKTGRYLGRLKAKGRKEKQEAILCYCDGRLMVIAFDSYDLEEGDKLRINRNALCGFGSPRDKEYFKNKSLDEGLK